MKFAKNNNFVPKSEIRMLCGFGVLASYFALKFDNDGDHCFANSESNTPIISHDVDVGFMLRTGF